MTVKKFFILLLVLAISLALFLVLRHYVSLETMIEQEEWLRAASAAHPVLSLLVAFVVYVVISLIPGTTGKSLVFAWLFGFLPGLLLVNGGLTVAAPRGTSGRRFTAACAVWVWRWWPDRPPSATLQCQRSWTRPPGDQRRRQPNNAITAGLTRTLSPQFQLRDRYTS